MSLVLIIKSMAESLPSTSTSSSSPSSNFTDILSTIKIKSIEKTLAPLINQVSARISVVLWHVRSIYVFGRTTVPVDLFRVFDEKMFCETDVCLFYDSEINLRLLSWWVRRSSLNSSKYLNDRHRSNRSQQCLKLLYKE